MKSIFQKFKPQLAQRSMLYLAEAFMKGQNFQRQCIAATFRRCKFREIPCLEIFLNRIMPVQHQNDFTARAALLAVLGGLSEHLVKDSNHEFEKFININLIT